MRTIPFYALTGIMLTLSACRQLQAPVSQTPSGELMAGNARFAAMRLQHPHDDDRRLHEIAKAQHPFAAVVSCSDSRVPPELVFDQGLGDLFVVRTAGNMLGGLEIGSIEYAVEHLGVKLVVVMGHRQCGALKAFVQGGEVPGHIRDIVDSIRAEVEISAVPADDRNKLDDCILANIRHGMRQLRKQSSLIEEKCREGALEIRGALYELDNGKVQWIDP